MKEAAIDRMSARNDVIVSRRLSGATLGQIAREFGLTRERVRQICTRADVNHTRVSRQVREANAEREQREQQIRWEEEVKASDRRCAVCGSQMHPSVASRIRTCGGECAEVWAKARYHLDEDQWRRHRQSVAKSIINNSGARSDSEITWATKVIEGQAPPPRGRWLVPGSDVERLVTEVLPRLRGDA